MLRADSPDERRRWFVGACACRRRPQARLETLPPAAGLATVLTVEDEFHVLVQARAYV